MRLTPKNLIQVLVQLEPVWQRAKEDEEDSETEQQKGPEDRRCVPNLTSDLRQDVVQRQAVARLSTGTRLDV